MKAVIYKNMNPYNGARDTLEVREHTGSVALLVLEEQRSGEHEHDRYVALTPRGVLRLQAQLAQWLREHTAALSLAPTEWEEASC